MINIQSEWELIIVQSRRAADSELKEAKRTTHQETQADS